MYIYNTQQHNIMYLLNMYFVLNVCSTKKNSGVSVTVPKRVIILKRICKIQPYYVSN